MGVCLSCLRGQERTESESSRLLDEDIYQAGFNYGTVQGPPPGPELETLKREREALEAICQRASDSVVDIWAIQSQPFVPSAQSSAQASRIPSSEATITQATFRADTYNSTQSPPRASHRSQSSRQSSSPTPGEFAGMRYVSCRNPDYPNNVNLSAVPKHWGEVVMSTRKGKKTRPALNLDNDKKDEIDVFGVLKVK
ncbi:hypothetical protein McanMca71_005484 [Microsporum canis]|uniref:Uncharacterized protein n=1 Tax=Arthroderma otae (strain ATCC MYA-4605 / CBS 113480) TaxID=554155 RepID=C5FQH3_ARTOC|nr:conserved hypothetical protein [Microsporum canis CBS 113480]EEQ32126.1 conserved hypothetical protein [Microsporum canis CBS 113480]